MCVEWNATKLWTFDYLIAKSGGSTSMISMLAKNFNDTRPWTALHRPMRTPGRLQDSIEKIKNNSHTSVWVEGEPPKRLNLYYLDDDLLRAPSLRQDYQFPYLHKFLRLQKTSLSIWPQEAPHLRPRQSKEEQFMCLTSG